LRKSILCKRLPKKKTAKLIAKKLPITKMPRVSRNATVSDSNNNNNNNNNNNKKVLKKRILQRMEVSMLFTTSYLPNLTIDTVKKKSFF